MVTVTLFKREREVVRNATETAKRSINTSLVVACIAVIISVIALVVGVTRRG